MSTLNALKIGGSAAIVALSLAAAAIVALPAQAASFTFGGPGGNVTIGDGNGPGFGPGRGPGPGMRYHFGDSNYFRYCLDDRGVVRLVQRQYDFDFLKISRDQHDDDMNNRVWLTGVMNHNFYQIRVDRCSQDIRLRKVGRAPQNNDFSHFSLNFNF